MALGWADEERIEKAGYSSIGVRSREGRREGVSRPESMGGTPIGKARYAGNGPPSVVSQRAGIVSAE